MSNVLNPSFRQIAIKGSSKVFYKSDKVGEFVLLFENDNQKISFIKNKLSQIIFELLNDCFIPNHFIKAHGLKEQIVSALEMLPFSVHVNAFTTKEMAKRLYCSSNMRLKNYLIELYLKETPDGIISPEHIISFEWLSKEELDGIFQNSRRVMDVLFGFFKAFGIVLTSVSLKYGRGYKDGSMYDILLADEMTLKNMNFFILDTIEDNEEAKYIEIAKRLGILNV